MTDTKAARVAGIAEVLAERLCLARHRATRDSFRLGPCDPCREWASATASALVASPAMQAERAAALRSAASAPDMPHPASDLHRAWLRDRAAATEEAETGLCENAPLCGLPRGHRGQCTTEEA